MRGSVVFTFDGDAAGQKAALRAFEEDQRFVTQTFVAVEPTGLDPCDLRLQHGDAAVVALVERRVPLFEFAIKSTLANFDLETAEGPSTRVDPFECFERFALSQTCRCSRQGMPAPRRR